jgi:hypothetical protein
MARTLLRLSAAALVLGLSVACIVFEDPAGDPGWRTTRRDRPDERTAETPEDQPLEQPLDRPAGAGFRETVDFAPGGTLTLENDYGDVEIRGWDRGEVEIVARSETAAAAPRDIRSARQAAGREAAPRIEIRETNRGLLVRTPTFEGLGEPPAIDYEVRVHESVRLTGIRISEGDLTVTGVYGDLEASVDKGDLLVRNYSGPVRATLGTGTADVEVLDLRDRDEITISSRRGDIVLRLESGVGAIVEADAPRGEVISDFDLGRRLPASTVKGWIGQGGPSIILRASDGRIEIVRTRAASDGRPAPAGR